MYFVCRNALIKTFCDTTGGSTVLYPFVSTLHIYDNRIWAI